MKIGFHKKTLKEKLINKVGQEPVKVLAKKSTSLLFGKQKKESFLDQIRSKPFSFIWTHGKKLLIGLGAFFLAKKLIKGLLHIPILLIRRTFSLPISIIKKIFK